MFTKRRVTADADHFSLKWAPVLLRFFQLFVGNQSVAETLTIDTLAEYVRTASTRIDDQTGVLLLRRAVMNGIIAPSDPTCTDPLVRATTQLGPMERAAVVLHRGLSFGIEKTAEILKVHPSEGRRLCVSGLSELSRLLSRGEMKGPHTSPLQNPICNSKEWSK